MNDRISTWTPPQRPDWVAKVNAEGDCMDLKSVVPLDENSLLDCARRNTGLSDFGAEDWHEPFQVFIKSLDDEAQLNLLGRLQTRQDILLFLEARLRIEDTYKQHPEIDDQEIAQPIMVMGQGRSGTSFMQNLLAEDPDIGTLMTWESMMPCPPPEKASYRSDPRIEKFRQLATQMGRVTPEIMARHEFGVEMPMESIHLLCITFMSPSWLNILGQVPSYNAYIASKDFTVAYRYEKRILKLLQWKNPRQRWLLKTPDYLLRMPELLKVYPDAWLLWVHRDPVRALASTVSQLGTLHWIRSDHPHAGGSLEMFSNPELSAAMMSQPIDWIEKGVVPRERLCDVQYLDLVKDPVGTVEQVYRYFGIEFKPAARQAMTDYMARHPRDSRPPHQYSAGTPEQIARERAVYRRYQEYFRVPSEP